MARDWPQHLTFQPCATDAVRLVSMKFLLKTLLALGVGLATAALL